MRLISLCSNGGRFGPVVFLSGMDQGKDHTVIKDALKVPLRAFVIE
jgi:hypothetical protein